MSLTTVQLASFRRKIGDTGTAQAFSDHELQEIYTEAGGNFDRAVLMAYEELAANAAKFTDYTANSSSEQRSQIFKHIMDSLIPYWAGKVNKSGQIKIVGLIERPPREVDDPDAGHTRMGIRRRGGYFRR